MKLITLDEFRKLPLAAAISGAYVVDLRVFPPTCVDPKDLVCAAVTADQIVCAEVTVDQIIVKPSAGRTKAKPGTVR